MKTRLLPLLGNIVCICLVQMNLYGTLRTVELSTNASFEQTQAARQALREGSVVLMRFVDTDQFFVSLGVRLVLPAGAPPSGTDRKVRSCLLAARLAEGRYLSTFVGPPVTNGHRPERQACEQDFSQWFAKQSLVRSTPDPDSWTHLGTSTYPYNTFSTEFDTYRATSDSSASAYYMFVHSMTDATSSPSVKSCSISMEVLQPQPAPTVSILEYGNITSSPGTPSAIGGSVPSSTSIVPYQPDNWVGNPSSVVYSGNTQQAGWVQQYTAGEASTEVRVTAFILQVPRATSPISVDVHTSCTDGTTSSSVSDTTYAVSA